MTVTLFEQFELRHTRGSSHGRSRIYRLAYDEPDYIRLAQRALPLWREAERERGTKLIRQTGALDIGPRNRLEPIARALRHEGATCAFLSRTEIEESSPFMSTGEQDEVLYQPDGGTIHADIAAQGFVDLARSHGAVIEADTRVRSIDAESNGVTLDTTKGESRARQVVIAAAGWSNSLLEPLGLAVPITTTREHVLYYPPIAHPVIPFIWHLPGHAPEFYGLPNGDEIKLGEHGAGPATDPNDAGEIDAARIERVGDFARHHLRDLSAEPNRAETCLYASTPDDDFILDRIGQLVLAFGFGGHGFKFGPLLGELAADLVEGKEMPFASRFSRSRFTLSREAS